MRVIETIHPNTQCRTFTTDQIISNVYLSYTLELIGPSKHATPEVIKLYTQLQDIPLLEKDISVDRYNISLKIEEAFENSEQDWNNIRTAVFYCLANFFKVDLSDIEKAHSIKDDRKKFTETVVDFYALAEMLSMITIPHDFKTHRAAWRDAIENQLAAVKDTIDNPKSAGFDGDAIYWQNELDKFDAAFDKLLALNLPTDA